MTPRLALVSIVLILAAAPALLASPARIARPGAELRAQPGFAGAVIARPAAGSSAEIVAADDEWRRVRLPDGAEGWVHELFVAAIPGGSPPAPPAAPAAPATPPRTASPDEERGRLLADLAGLRMELAAATRRAADAEAAAMRADARARQAESVRDEALARAQAAESRAAAGGVPEEVLEQVREEATREADARCAHDISQQVEDAVEQAMATLTSSEAETQRIDRAVEARVAVLQAQHAVELMACRAAAGKGAAAPPEPSAAPAAPAADEVARLAQALADEKAAHAADVERIEDEHQRLHDTYVEIVTQRHEEALQREREACKAAWERGLLEERRRHDREIRTARKESGYEAEMEKELRERTKLAVQEAEARWEARRRGEAYDEQRVRREEEERVRRLCDAERLTAVQSALATQSAEIESLRRREREEADLRCQVALELVLERAAEGGDLSQVRDLARERTRPADPSPHDMAAPEGAAP